MKNRDIPINKKICKECVYYDTSNSEYSPMCSRLTSFDRVSGAFESKNSCHHERSGLGIFSCGFWGRYWKYKKARRIE